MGDVRITQLPIEVIAQSDPDVQVTQNVVETLATVAITEEPFNALLIAP
jgi:hypothetical protein